MLPLWSSTDLVTSRFCTCNAAIITTTGYQEPFFIFIFSSPCVSYKKLMLKCLRNLYLNAVTQQLKIKSIQIKYRKIKTSLLVYFIHSLAWKCPQLSTICYTMQSRWVFSSFHYDMTNHPKTLPCIPLPRQFPACIQTATSVWLVITTSLKLTTSSEANSCSGRHEILQHLRNLMGRWSVTINLPLVTILSHLNKIHFLTSYLSKTLLNSILQCMPRSPKSSITFWF